jgi:hypothetical protein
VAAGTGSGELGSWRLEELKSVSRVSPAAHGTESWQYWPSCHICAPMYPQPEGVGAGYGFGTGCGATVLTRNAQTRAAGKRVLTCNARS